MRKLVYAMILMVFMIAPSYAAMKNEDVPRITPQELKAKLDKGEKVVILDVRSRGSYDSSKVKIKGALRIPPDELKTRAQEIPMGREIATY